MIPGAQQPRAVSPPHPGSEQPSPHALRPSLHRFAGPCPWHVTGQPFPVAEHDTAHDPVQVTSQRPT